MRQYFRIKSSPKDIEGLFNSIAARVTGSQKHDCFSVITEPGRSQVEALLNDLKDEREFIEPVAISWLNDDGEYIHTELFFIASDGFVEVVVSDVTKQKKMMSDLDFRNRELEILNQLFSYNTATNSPDEFLSLSLEFLLRLVETDKGALYVFEEGSFSSNIASEEYKNESFESKGAIFTKEKGVLHLIEGGWWLYSAEDKDTVVACMLSAGQNLIQENKYFVGIVMNKVATILRNKNTALQLQGLRKNLEAQIAQRTMKIERSNELLQILTKLSTEFINLTPDKIGVAIDKALETIGKFTRVDRVYLFRYDYLDKVAINTHEWCAENIRPEKDNLQRVPFGMFPDILEKHQGGEEIYFPRVADLPDDYSMRDVLLQQDIKSVILIPLLHGGECIGFVGFDAVSEERGFGEIEVTLLKVLAEVLANAEIRLKDQVAIRESEEKYRNLVEKANDGILIVQDGVLKFANQRLVDLTGYSLEETIGASIENFVPGEAKSVIIQNYKKRIAGESPPSIYEAALMKKNGEELQVELNSNLMSYQGKQGVLVFVRDITERKQAEEKIHALSMKVLNAYEEERRRLARELHDEIGQALTAVKLDLQMVDRNHKQVDLQRSIELLRKTINNMRHQITSLRPPFLENISLTDALRDLIREIGRQPGVFFKINDDHVSKRFSEEVEIAIYRCVQESLTNVVKHANANEVTVNLFNDSEFITVEVIDNGVGFDPLEVNLGCSKQIGITGMKERAALLGGNAQIETTQGEGTAVFIKIPIERGV